MRRKAWKTFVNDYPESDAFIARVSRVIPKGPHFDKRQQRLPTPYRLLQEWLSGTLSGPWTSDELPGGLVVRIAAREDAALLIRRFPIIKKLRKTEFGERTFQIRFGDSDYGPLAKEVGYQLT